MEYLKLPLDLSSALEGKMERCSYAESIAQHIMTLIVSQYGEVESKDDYGSVIWNLEFNKPYLTKIGRRTLRNRWKEPFQNMNTV